MVSKNQIHIASKVTSNEITNSYIHPNLKSALKNIASNIASTPQYEDLKNIIVSDSFD